MTKLLELPDFLRLRRQHGFWDHFTGGDVKVGDGSTDIIQYTITADAGGAQGLDVDGVGGIYSIATDGDDNDEAYIETRELVKFAAGKPFIFEALVQYAEANTDDANVVVGVVDAPGANTLADNGGGAAINDSGALIYKVDGGTVWRFKTNLGGGTATDSVSQTTAGGAAYQTLRIEARDVNATDIELVPFVDGVQLKDSNDKPIKHTVTLGTATEMALVAGAKAGGANAETLLIDYWGYEQLI